MKSNQFNFDQSFKKNNQKVRNLFFLRNLFINYMYYVGCDIGGTHVRVVVCDEESLLIKMASNTVRTGPPESLGIQIIGLIEKAMKELGISAKEIKGIGTSSAGPFVGGQSLATPNICTAENDWQLIPYLQTLKAHFGEKIKYELGNDCVSSVKAEHLFGAGIGYKNCVYITISTGVGSGIIDNGHLMEGKGKNAGHFGHMIVQKDGDKCGCGQRGCIETIISGKSIEHRAKKAGLLINNSKDYSAKEVFEQAQKDNPLAKKIIDETIEYIGILLINVINATDTDILIIGGSVFMNNADYIQPQVEQYISENSMVVLSEGVQIKTPLLGEFVGDLAGLSLVFPEHWIEKWTKTQPWKKGIQKIINVQTQDSLKY
jgi:glucokinase